jgi:hypothetical protein
MSSRTARHSSHRPDLGFSQLVLIGFPCPCFSIPSGPGSHHRSSTARSSSCFQTSLHRWVLGPNRFFIFVLPPVLGASTPEVFPVRESILCSPGLSLFSIQFSLQRLHQVFVALVFGECQLPSLVSAPRS